MAEPITTTAAISLVGEEDATSVLDYLECVAGETDPLTFGPGQYGRTVEDEEEHIRKLLDPTGGFIAKATVEGHIVGMAGISRSSSPRIRHVGVFGISVRKEYLGKGIARAICTWVLDESQRRGLERIELRVREDNARGIGLYTSLGFAAEGRLRRSFCAAGHYYDELLMGLWLAAPPVAGT
jgi:RimJ/RimL family protein N-acetyltransferase